MSEKTASESAREDLAFIRALVAPDDKWQQQFGKLYFAAGALYTIQMAAHVGQLTGVVPGDGLIALAIGWGPTAIFIAILIWVLRRDGARPPSGTSRAIGAAFGAVGLANLALCVSIGSVALRLHSQTIWFIYPVVVMVLQGLAWMVAYSLRRKGWLGLVALGWFAVGIAMAIFIENMVAYVGAATVGIVCFMAVPGFHLMRRPRPTGQSTKIPAA